MSLGFEVRTLDVTGIYRLGGAARCLVNVLRRGDLNSKIGTSTNGQSQGLQIIDLVGSQAQHINVSEECASANRQVTPGLRRLNL